MNAGVFFRVRGCGRGAAPGARRMWWLLVTGLLLAAFVVARSAEGGAAERVEGSVASAKALVAYRAESTVNGPVVRLGDIAEIRSKDPALAQRLGAIEVGRSPLPGLSRILDPAYIQARLRLERVDPSAIVFDTPPSITVLAASQRVGGEELLETVRKHILSARRADAMDLAIQATAPPRDLVLPTGSLILKVRGAPAPDGTGTAAPLVEAWVDGTLVRTVSVPVRLSALFDVLVASHPIAQRALIGPEDVRVDRREILAGQEPLREVGAVLGRRAMRNIAPGEPILATLVELPPLVRRGEIVQLLAEGHGLRAATQAEAREEGKLGQTIRVRNLTSGKEIYGQVQAEGIVRVPF